MAKNRIIRINDELRRELSDLFRTVKDPRVQDCMLSITRVDTTSDLRYAKVYVSALDKSKEANALKGLRSAGGYLRRQLGSALKLRYTPELVFEADDSIEHGAHILEVLHQIEERDGSLSDSEEKDDGGDRT